MSDASDLDRQIEQLKKCEIIKEAEVKALCAKAREILIEESNVQRVDSPVTVSKRFFTLFFNISPTIKQLGFNKLLYFKKLKQHPLILYRYAVTFTVSFMIWKNFLKSEAMYQKQITCLWEISSTEVSTVSKRFCSFWLWR